MRISLLVPPFNEANTKGAAIRAAMSHIDDDIAVIQDADREYDPAEVPALTEPIVRGVTDVVFGSRLIGSRPQRAYPFWRKVGNRFLSVLTVVLFNTTPTDMETGTRCSGLTSSRSYAEGKKITWRDGNKAVRVLPTTHLFG